MYFIRNMFIYLMVLLLALSLYKDLTIGTTPFNENKLQPIEQTNLKKVENKLSVVEFRVQPGDTVLSVTEQLNHQLVALDVTQIISDFKTINPHTDPYQLQFNTTYFFPVY